MQSKRQCPAPTPILREFLIFFWSYFFSIFVFLSTFFILVFRSPSFFLPSSFCSCVSIFLFPFSFFPFLLSFLLLFFCFDFPLPSSILVFRFHSVFFPSFFHSCFFVLLFLVSFFPSVFFFPFSSSSAYNSPLSFPPKSHASHPHPFPSLILAFFCLLFLHSLHSLPFPSPLNYFALHPPSLALLQLSSSPSSVSSWPSGS